MQLIQTFTSSEKEACRTAEGLFAMLGEKFKPRHYETILSLWYYKLNRKSKELHKSG